MNLDMTPFRLYYTFGLQDFSEDWIPYFFKFQSYTQLIHFKVLVVIESFLSTHMWISSHSFPDLKSAVFSVTSVFTNDLIGVIHLIKQRFPEKKNNQYDIK